MSSFGYLQAIKILEYILPFLSFGASLVALVFLCIFVFATVRGQKRNKLFECLFKMYLLFSLALTGVRKTFVFIEIELFPIAQLIAVGVLASLFLLLLEYKLYKKLKVQIKEEERRNE